MPGAFSFQLGRSDMLLQLTAGWLIALSSVNCTAVDSPSRPFAIAGADLFTNGAIQQFQITVGPVEQASLAASPRDFVRATVAAVDQVFQDVGIHLKGATGSFRSVEDKPSFTLDFGRFKPGRAFQGLRRIHLNNSVEDPSYLNEWLGSEIFRHTGIPAPRIGHATVAFNGRRLGLYVLKEGFTEDLLKGYFSKISGDLYEPPEGGDVDSEMKRSSVDAPSKGRAVLKPLVDAVREPDPARQWERLNQVLDIKRFLTFMALEVLLCHRDGYCMARNNFRIYYDLDSGKMMFLPGGMDQLLGRPDLPWRPRMAGLVARLIVESPEGRTRYRQALTTTLTNLVQPDRLNEELDQIVRGLRQCLPNAEWADVKREAESLKDHLRQRYSWLESKLGEPEPAPLELAGGIARLHGWQVVDGSPKVTLDQSTLADGTRSLHIAAKSETSASWRTTALLRRARYRFEGRIRVANVQQLSFGKHQGAALRIAGDVRKVDGLTGTSDWREFSAEFSVAGDSQQVELICELRASHGEAWFDMNSLRLVQLP